MPIENRDQPVEQPTFLEHIRHFFDPIDVDHMMRRANIDLATYEGVKANAIHIYFQTSGGKMPPEPERRWPKARVKTFRNWINAGFPMGEAPPTPEIVAAAAAAAGSPAKRPNAANLTQSERDKVKLAFETLMSRAPEAADSYFSVAGIHWYPLPFFCAHHEPRYNPWHRVYIDRFEAAMRTVPGCEDVLLPYWDILKPVPEWLNQPPFDSYVLPREVGPGYPAGLRTGRNPPDVIAGLVAEYGIEADIRRGLNAPRYDEFDLAIEAAHDSGHGACGGSITFPDIASFDPLFWFFHCNWERMWWAWQVRHEATDLTSFRKTLATPGEVEWLDDPLFHTLEPFGVWTGTTIATDPYNYEEFPDELFEDRAAVRTGNIALERSFRLSRSPKLSLRVKDIARLRIRGSFVVHLLADGKPVAKRAFFQSLSPQECPGCLDRELVNVDFIVDRDEVAGKSLQARIESLDPDRIGQWISLDKVGHPTVNVRELLINE